MTGRPDSPLALPPRGLSRGEAARYIGVGTEAFDRLVEAGLMPPPKLIGQKRLVWDRFAVDAAFDDLPERSEATHDDPALADQWTPRA